jgi:hypothetical protein
MLAATIDPYATGVLKREHHDRLVAGLEGYARDAGIQPKWVWTPMSGVLNPKTADYFKKYHLIKAEGQVQGVVMLPGSIKADPETEMSSLAGGFVRNFVRARVMTLGTVVESLAKGREIEATVLLIPNFCFSKDEGGQLASWQTQIVHDLLLRRGQEGLHTILYATSVADIHVVYGHAARRLIESRYLNIEI